MTVLDLIKQLLDCPMNAAVSFVGTIDSSDIEGVEEGKDLDIDINIDNVRALSSSYVELSA